MPPARPTYSQLIERIEALEAKQAAKLDIKRFPMTALQEKLATDLQPDGDTFLLPKSVGTDSLEDDSVTAGPLGPNSVASANIIDGTIATADIANEAVTTPKILLDNQHLGGVGTSGGYSVGAGGFYYQVYRKSDATLPLELSYTPTVDVYWEVSVNLAQLYIPVTAGWAYIQANLRNVSATDTIADNGILAVAAGAGATVAITTAFGPGGPVYTSLHLQHTFALAGGVTYAVRPYIYPSTATWAHVTGVDTAVGGAGSYVTMDGKAWAR